MANLNLPTRFAILAMFGFLAHQFFQSYAFHQVMRSLFVPLRMATDARNLTFEIDLDHNIDIVCVLSLTSFVSPERRTCRLHEK